MPFEKTPNYLAIIHTCTNTVSTYTDTLWQSLAAAQAAFFLLALMKQGRAFFGCYFQAAASVLQSRCSACWEQNSDPYFNNVHPVFSLA